MLLITKWIVATVLYVQIVLILLIVRPALMFDSNGNPKPFGVGMKEGKSVFAPAIVFPVLAFLCYVIASFVNFVWV